jgi:ABC-type multidrug transport system, ATPase and permease components
LKFAGLGIAILAVGLLEVIGVASILPFMQLIGEPNAIEQSSMLSAGYQFFGFEGHQEMFIYFGIGIIVLIGITNTFTIFTTWLKYKYTWNIAHNLSIRLLNRYIEKSYNFFLNTNTTKLQTYIISEVNSLTGGVILPFIELISRLFAVTVIFTFLLTVDAQIALIMFGSLGSAYTLIYLSQKSVLRKIGKHRIEMNMLRYKSLQEFLDGIKTVMVYNKQNFFYDRFEYASNEFCNVQPKYNLLLAVPKYVLEFLAFGGILGVTMYLYINSGNIQSAIPRLSLYAVAGYRLLPALQKIFTSIAKIRHNYPVLERLHDDLKYSLKYSNKSTTSVLPQMDFKDLIEVNQLRFTFDNAENTIIKGLNLNIIKGEVIAFVGSTGSGKTTLVDLLVGLLQPTSGSINIDGVPLNSKNIKSWRNILAYVPQEVFLFDDTVLKNLVIGNQQEIANFEKLKQVCQIANILDFIEQELPKGFETKIGERGVRLSGGQRQRLGLARALYTNPQLLILDEATSALDSITEKNIISSLKQLPNNITTIIIAHRLSTIKHADCIYVLDDGNILSKGNYDNLMKTNDAFRTMVKLS